jgi:hypothetical protein
MNTEPTPERDPIDRANSRASAELQRVNEDLGRALLQEEVLLSQPSDDLDAQFEAWRAARERCEGLERAARFLTLYIDALTKRAGVELGPRRR